MGFCTFEIILILFSVGLHDSSPAIIHRHLEDWQSTNSILSKTDHLPSKHEDRYEPENREINHMIVEDDYSDEEEHHISEDYLSDNDQNYGSESKSEINNITEVLQEARKPVDNDVEIRFKKLVGVDDMTVSGVRHARRHKPSKYMQELFSALSEYDAQNQHVTVPGREIPIPTIRSYRCKSIKAKSSGQRSHIFVCSNITEASPKYGRVEMVIQKDPWNTATTFQLSVSVPGGAKIEVSAAIEGNYLIFDLTGFAEYLGEQFRPTLQLSSSGENIRIRRRPLLVIYEHMNFNPLLRSSRVRRESYNYLSNLTALSLENSDDGFNCRRYDWELDIKIFQWKWFIAPRYYNAGYCSGDCPFPLDSPTMNSTNYSLIKNLFHYTTGFRDEYVAKACCTPIAYQSQAILYFDRGMNSVLKNLPNMKVTACGCR